MMKTLLYTLFLGLVIFNGTAFAASEGSDSTTLDWRKTALEAKKTNRPVILVFESDGCPYCERLKKSVLTPMLREGELDDLALVGAFDIGTGGKIKDFDGEKVRARRFVSRYNVFATPTVVIVDAHGRELADPIVGFDDPDTYRERLAKALQASRALLTRPVVKSNAVARVHTR
ncbi:MAG TPA: hypothetical protein EYH03_06710 [Chromatiales bacterium]|nr:hypothetical protein [Chromatiales bacterium]